MQIHNEQKILLRILKNAFYDTYFFLLLERFHGAVRHSFPMLQAPHDINDPLLITELFSHNVFLDAAEL